MMYALFSGHTPQEALVMANLASGYNCLQYGPYPLYTDEVRRQALGPVSYTHLTYSSKCTQSVSPIFRSIFCIVY